MASHLFVDISSHGFGHLAQVAPILNELARQRPEGRLTVRCGLPSEKIRSRLRGNFTHIPGRSDFGFVMHDAVSIDHATTAQNYRDQHANWPQRVADEAAFLATLKPDLVLTDVAYLPLAGAVHAGIRSLSMCSLNWFDLFTHFYGNEAWAEPIQREILAAYSSAEYFLRLTPAMPMRGLPRLRAIAPVAALGQDQSAELRARLSCTPDTKLVLVAFGGFDKDLNAAHWPCTADVHWLIPEHWAIDRADMSAFEPLGLSFTDLLCSVDAVVTKPGYGTFTEAACNGTSVVYVRRDNWPEQACLIEWLTVNARCREISETMLINGCFQETFDALWRQPVPPRPEPTGAAEVAALLVEQLTCCNSKDRPSVPADPAG